MTGVQTCALPIYYTKLYKHHSSPHQYINLNAIHDNVTNALGAIVPTGKRVLGRNLGDGVVIMSIEIAANTPVPGPNRKSIPAHAAASALADDIRNGGGNFLNYYNANPFDILMQSDIYDE